MKEVGLKPSEDRVRALTEKNKAKGGCGAKRSGIRTEEKR